MSMLDVVKSYNTYRLAFDEGVDEVEIPIKVTDILNCRVMFRAAKMEEGEIVPELVPNQCSTMLLKFKREMVIYSAIYEVQVWELEGSRFTIDPLGGAAKDV